MVPSIFHFERYDGAYSLGSGVDIMKWMKDFFRLRNIVNNCDFSPYVRGFFVNFKNLKLLLGLGRVLN